MSAPDPDRMRIVGLRLLQRVADRWHLDDAQRALLLGVSREAFDLARADPLASITPAMLTRISHVLAIFTALQSLLPQPQCDEWVHGRNTAPGFDGRPALARMLSPDAAELRAVREYLDAELNR